MCSDKYISFPGQERITNTRNTVVTIFTLVASLLIYLLRIVLFPRHVAYQFRHGVMEASCLACISIAFTTIIQMTALTLTASWAPSWGMAAWVMWWVNAAMAALCCIVLPYVFIKVEGRMVECFSPSVLLPLIAALTAAAGGGVVCRYGSISPELQVPVIIVSYLFIGLGLPFSLVIDAAVFIKLCEQGFPRQQNIYQFMILCGPLGQGSFALQILGNCVQRGAFAKYDNSSLVNAAAAKTISTASEWLGLITWGYGTFWWGFACITIIHYLLNTQRAVLRWDKSLSTWSMVFPWGVYTNGAVQLGMTLNSRAFWVWQTVLLLFLICIWLANVAATFIGVVNGNVFGLDRGWGGKYYSNSAEKEKESHSQNRNHRTCRSESNGGDHGSHDKVNEERDNIRGSSATLRQPEL